MPVTGRTCFAEWEEVGPVTVVRLVVRGAAEVQEILDLFEQLDRVLRDDGARRILLNFAGVAAFTSYPIGKLIALDRKMRALGGRLALCDLTPAVAEAIDVMNLRRQFTIYPAEQDALQAL